MDGLPGGIGDLKTFFGLDGGIPLDFKAMFAKIFEDGNLLGKLAELIGEAFHLIVQGLADGLSKVADKLADLAKKVAGLLADLWERIVKFLNDGFSLKKAFPDALERGSLAGIKAARELASFLSALPTAELANLKDRIEVVADSFVRLIDAAGGKEGLFFVSKGVEEFGDLLSDLIDDTTSPEEKLRGLVIKLLVPDALVSKSQAVELLKSVVQGRWWAWADLPGGLVPGALHGWVNDPKSYSRPDLIPLARRFRCRVVAAVDAYLRSKVSEANVPQLLTNSDGRLSFESLSDLVCALIDTTIQFVFEPEGFPLLDGDLDGFEDVGIGFAGMFARQIRLAIRGVMGMLFRGVWIYSLQSDSLIELIASIFSVTFSAIVESVVRHLTWTVRVVSRYKGDPFGGSGGVLTWDSLDRAEFIQGGGPPLPVDRIRRFRPRRGAQLQLCLVQVRWLPRGIGQGHGGVPRRLLPAVPAGQPLPEARRRRGDDLCADIVGDHLTVFATTSAFAEIPRPVLRVYIGNHILIMRPAVPPPTPISSSSTSPPPTGAISN